MNRDLDGCYFRVKRKDRYQNVCFSDLTEEEQLDVMHGQSADWLKSLCLHLAHSLRELGDEFDIVCA